MAKRTEDFPLTKHTLNLYEGDWSKLQDVAAEISHRGGAGKIVRDLVRGFLNGTVSAGPKIDLKDLELME